MEANINNYTFKHNEKTLFIEVYDSENFEEPYSFIKVNVDLTEKDFHFEISDWFLKNVNSF